MNSNKYLILALIFVASGVSGFMISRIGNSSAKAVSASIEKPNGGVDTTGIPDEPLGNGSTEKADSTIKAPTPATNTAPEVKPQPIPTGKIQTPPPTTVPGTQDRPILTPDQVPVALEVAGGGKCFHDEQTLVQLLTLYAEDSILKKKILYDANNPEKLADCSGIFHRTAKHLKTRCDQYIYPDFKKARDSRSLAKWYYDHNNLIIVNDLTNQADYIQPGSVMFFGYPYKAVPNPTIKVLTTRGEGIMHIGVVTAVKRNAAGKVEKYTMLHGRSTGKIAGPFLVNETSDKGPKFGHWGQPLLAIAPFIGSNPKN